jgi:hypothetical protein
MEVKKFIAGGGGGASSISQCKECARVGGMTEQFFSRILNTTQRRRRKK